MTPYYEDGTCTIYHGGDVSRETLARLAAEDYCEEDLVTEEIVAFWRRAVDALLAHPVELVAALEEAGILEQVGNLHTGSFWSMKFAACEGDEPVFRVSSRLPWEAE